MKSFISLPLSANSRNLPPVSAFGVPLLRIEDVTCESSLCSLGLPHDEDDLDVGEDHDGARDEEGAKVVNDQVIG